MPKILLVDDDTALRETFAQALRLADYSVAEASDGFAALDLIAACRFDVIVTELLIPEMDGIELLMALKDRKITCPVLVITGGFRETYGRHDRVTGACLAAARELGAMQTLLKPILPSALVQEIRHLSSHANAA